MHTFPRYHASMLEYQMKVGQSSRSGIDSGDNYVDSGMLRHQTVIDSEMVFGPLLATMCGNFFV